MIISRRKVMQWLAGAASAALPAASATRNTALHALLTAPAPVTSPPTEISGIFLDLAKFHHDANSNGDTWDHMWAEDDILYSFNCDGRGYAPPGTEGRNVSFNKLVGNAWDALTGSPVSLMDYGKGGAQEPNASNWKVTGGDSIDGVLYAFIANNWYGSQNAFGGDSLDPHIRQSVNNMSLIKSTDNGLTWTRDAQTNYDHPMWTSRKFSTGFFFKYGKNGGSTKQDGQDRFVYAISNDGFWNSGSNFYLGRVARAKIGDLNPNDWEYLSGGSWSRRVDDATPIPGFPNGQMKCASGSPIWLASIRKYVTVTWFDPGASLKWYFPENVTFAFYQANHPWGPWSWIGEQSARDFIADRKQRIHLWYGPSLSPRFITANSDGSVTAILTFSGQTWEDKPEGLYKNNSLPVTFYTAPQLKDVQCIDDSEAKYSSGWTVRSDELVGDFRDDVHITTTQGAYADFQFSGRGIEILSEKSSELGDVEVLLDGVSMGTFNLYQDPMPRLYQVPFYRNMGLHDGPHTVRIVNKAPTGTACILDGFRVYRSNDFDPDGFYSIVNRANRKVLGSARKGQSIEAVENTKSHAAHWIFKADSAGNYRIVNRESGKSLSVGEAESLSQQVAAASPSFHWKALPVGNGTFSILNRGNGLAITAAASPASGAFIQAIYYGRDDQKWEIVPVA
jgi:hypothetical protein